MRSLQNIKLVILLLPYLFMFCACDDDSNPTSSVSHDDRLIGNWSLTKISVTSLSMELTPEQAKFMMTIDVKNDGTFSMTTTDSTGTLTEAGEWSTADNTIKISYENGVTDELPYNVISANEITVTSPIEMQGMQIVADLTFRKE